MSRLQGKIAVVTGASKGIGASIAEHFGAEGASVVVNYSSSKPGAAAVVKKIQDKGGKAVAIQADLSKPEDVSKLFQETKKAYGKLDILVNTAGVYEFQPIEILRCVSGAFRRRLIDDCPKNAHLLHRVHKLMKIDWLHDISICSKFIARS